MVFIFNNNKDTLQSVIKLSLHKDTLVLLDSDHSIFSDSIASYIELVNYLRSYYFLSKNEKSNLRI